MTQRPASPEASRPTTVAELRAAGYRPRSVKEEIRENLVRRLRTGDELFPGIHGYGDTVVPELVNALLAGHDFVLLGLRGQAKSRIVRQLVDLLDPEVPALAGSEVNDDPLGPISKQGRELLEEHGEEAPVEWVSRDRRFVEKLATPDVTVADIVGDLDPIRAARGGHLLADELAIHFGLLPRANRGIFAINELPDLAGKIQVALFNVLQEGDVQVKGFPVRLPLDVLMVFTANPEDYTARGKIITPLKDRIGSEIRTHYPEEVETGMAITSQEAALDRDDVAVEVPGFIAETVERVAFLARRDKRIDQRSGVSQRMPVTMLEVVVSSAERRALRLGEEQAVPRLGDVHAALPAVTGKLELEYEGELQGPEPIARELVSSAAAESFRSRAGDTEVERIVTYFEEGGALRISPEAGGDAALKGFQQVDGLLEVVDGTGLAGDGASPGVRSAACELVLEALVAERRISRSEEGGYGRARYPGSPGQGPYGKGPKGPGGPPGPLPG